MPSIRTAYLELAIDEGPQHALNELQRAQVVLEGLCECGSFLERGIAGVLLESVNASIRELLPYAAARKTG